MGAPPTRSVRPAAHGFEFAKNISAAVVCVLSAGTSQGAQKSNHDISYNETNKLFVNCYIEPI